MKKVSLFFIFAVFILGLNSCNESATDIMMDNNTLSLKISQDETLTQFMDANDVIMNSIDKEVAKRTTKEAKEEYQNQIANLVRNGISEQNFERYSILLGFKSTDDYTKAILQVQTSYLHIEKNFKGFSTLDAGTKKEVLRNAIVIRNNEIAKNLAKNGRVENCVYALRDCYVTAKQDFYIASAACGATGRIFGPLAWAACQGTANPGLVVSILLYCLSVH